MFHSKEIARFKQYILL